MKPHTKDDIPIPDHEVLRKIGGGAYGEVWMARGVTGALRAVKIVWRKDFEDERSFEREFDGVLKFEPISRDHPGLVNILHVGRSGSEKDAFYYYIMELGDDVHTVRDIKPAEYEARTLRSDLKAQQGKPLETTFAITIAKRLAGALRHLHSLGLTHRDIKPANVIFVEGKAKLADVGLVAARGQETFVGTEGFVPPEGPGNTQADVYSLGKVMYEMITGKDRLQFPELPDDVPSGDTKQWLQVNELICSVCEPKLSNRTIDSAEKLVAALNRIIDGKRVRLQKKSRRHWVAAMILAGIALGYLIHKKPWDNSEQPDAPIADGGDPSIKPPVYQHEMCKVDFVAFPPVGVTAYIDDDLDGVSTPTPVRAFRPGRVVSVKFSADGYKEIERDFVIPDKAFESFLVELQEFSPPQRNLEWVDAVGMRYFPRLDYHESGYLQRECYESFLKEEPRMGDVAYEKYSEKGEEIEIAFMNEQAANGYVRWLEEKSHASGLLHDYQYITSHFDKDLLVGSADEVARRKQNGLYPLKMRVADIPYSTLIIESEPQGARVMLNGSWVGVTGLGEMVFSKIRPGKVELVVRLDGYKPYTRMVEFGENEKIKVDVKLEPNHGVVFGKKWINGLEMQLVPFAEGKMVSIWETRVQDYKTFMQETGHRAYRDPGFEQEANHPVVGVYKKDAEAFCKWLTEKERKEERIGPHHAYRLPTDQEWSAFAGIKVEEGDTPRMRFSHAQAHPSTTHLIYPWGEAFPPPVAVANLADQSALQASGFNVRNTIRNYDDGYTKTAPVGQFEPNALGIHDLSGNVYEWIDGFYNAAETLELLRGGSWATGGEFYLKTWNRFPVIRDKVVGNQYGFRIVLVDSVGVMDDQGMQPRLMK